jgi:tyrosine-protein phosphatase SIW14
MSFRIGVPALLVTLVLIGCSSGRYCAAPPRLARLDDLPKDPNAHDAYAALHSPKGPTRFSQVTPQLYRGGLPTNDQLAQLYALGVRTVISLCDAPTLVAEERTRAEHLGLKFLNFPFSGLSEPDPSQLHAIVAAMQDSADGSVYVHCQQGRDRTSLVVALYRVWVDAWAPAVAWHQEADDYGHGGWRHIFFRKLDRAFVRLTRG